MTGFWEGVGPQVEELTLFGRIKGESVEGFNGNLKLLEIELRPHAKKIPEERSCKAGNAEELTFAGGQVH